MSRPGRRRSNVNLLYSLVRSHDSICSLLCDRYVTTLFRIDSVVKADEASKSSPAAKCATDILAPFDRSHKAEAYARQITINRDILTPASIVELIVSSFKILDTAADDRIGHADGGLRSAAEVS